MKNHDDRTREPMRPADGIGTSTKMCPNPPRKRKHYAKRGNKSNKGVK